MCPPTLYKTGHSGSGVAAGVQYAVGEGRFRPANPDLPVSHFDAADELAHIALAQAGAFIAQPGAGRRGEAFDITLGQKVARHFTVLFEGCDHPQGFVAFLFHLRHRAAEHIGVADHAVGERPI
ncbi:MAG: hypothetical protein GC201_13350 [Alphaproteobacteria bacterium]|nr:hypothetical protein [Alphaproteobacteria bacterium]